MNSKILGLFFFASLMLVSFDISSAGPKGLQVKEIKSGNALLRRSITPGDHRDHDRFLHRTADGRHTIAGCANSLSAEGDTNVEYLSSTLWRNIYDVQVVENYAYCAFQNGLAILDVSSPEDPSLKRELYLGGAWRICVKESYAYITGPRPGLTIVDISDPSEPRVHGSCHIPGAYDVFVLDSLAFVAASDSGLFIISVSEPSSPCRRGSYLTPGYANDVFVQDSLAYIACDDSLHIISVSEPWSPRRRGSYGSLIWGVDIFVQDTVAYMVDLYFGSGLHIISVSNPSSPCSLGTYSLSGGSQAWEVFVRDNLAYLAESMVGLSIVSVSQPSSPYLLGSYGKSGGWQSVSLVDSLAYLAGDVLDIIAVSQDSILSHRGSYETPGWIRDVFVLGSYAFVAGGSSGLHIVHLHQPSNPLETGRDTSGTAYGVFARGSLAYVADGSKGLRIISFSDPWNPDSIGSCPTPGTAHGVFVQDTLAYVADYDSGLQIISVSDPSNPHRLGGHDTPGLAEDVFAQNGFAYVADGLNGLVIFDVSDPDSPVVVESYDTPGNALGVSVQDNLAFVADGYTGLLVLSVSEPSDPQPLGSYNTPGGYAQRVSVLDSLAYVADRFEGLHVISVSKPDNPYLLGSYNTPGNAIGVSVRDSLICVADGSSLMILTLQVNQPPTLTCPEDDSVHAGEYFVSTDFSAHDPDDGPVTVESCGVDPDPVNQPIRVGNHLEWQTDCADAGNIFTICLEVTDSRGAKDSCSFQVTVYNQPPNLTCPEDDSVHAGDLFRSADCSVSDPDDLTLAEFVVDSVSPTPTYSCTLVDNHVEWQTGCDDANTVFTICLKAADSCGATDTCCFQITAYDQPPEFSYAIGDKWIEEGKPFADTLKASDLDSDPIFFDAEGLPQGASLDLSTGGFSWTPNYGEVGKYHILFTVTDSACWLSDSANVTITVQNESLEVLQHYPGPDAEDVLIADTIGIALSEPIRCATVNRSTFWVESEKRGEFLEDSCYACDSTMGLLSFSLPADSMFLPLDTITVTLTIGIKDLADSAMAEDFSWKFYTGRGVYPGNTNNDSTVDERDILPLGLHWGKTGPPREGKYYQNISWSIQPVRRWDPPLGAYADADGSGTVGDKLDICAVADNWERKVLGSPQGPEGAIDYLKKDHQKYLWIYEKIYDALMCCPESEGKNQMKQFLEQILDKENIPSRFEVSQNYPNPFNATTVIRYSLPQDCQVEIRLFNILGQKVRTLVNEYQAAGYKRVTWDGKDDQGQEVGSGIHFYQVKAGSFSCTRKLLLLK